MEAAWDQDTFFKLLLISSYINSTNLSRKSTSSSLGQSGKFTPHLLERHWTRDAHPWSHSNSLLLNSIGFNGRYQKSHQEQKNERQTIFFGNSL